MNWQIPVLQINCVTSGDPILLWDGPGHGDNRKHAWVYYLKGAARASMALFTAVIAVKLGSSALIFIHISFYIITIYSFY